MRYRWWIAATLIACCTFIAAFMRTNEPPKQEGTLSDGTIVRFEKCGLGSINYDSYPPVKAKLAAYLPSSLQNGLGERARMGSSDDPRSLCFVFSVWSPDGKRQKDFDEPFSRFEFVESTGFVFDVKNTGYGHTSNLIAFGLAAFPRRDRELHMRLFESETDRLLFELKIPNPGYQPTVSEWQPEELPVSRTSAPLTVTLSHVPVGVSLNDLSDDDIEITSTDRRWTSTRLERSLLLSDATGNQVDDYILPSLSPFEPVWKLSLRIWRGADAEFSDDERWTTKTYPLPSSSDIVPIGVKQTVSGVEIEALMLCPAGVVSEDGPSFKVSPSTRTGQRDLSIDLGNRNAPFATIDSGFPFIPVTISAYDEDTEVLLTIRDQNGTKLSLNSGSSADPNLRIVQFDPKPESTEVQLEVIVSRIRKFEFFVKPPRPTTTP